MKSAIFVVALLAATVAGGAVLTDANVTNDCGESLYLIQSADCEGNQVSCFVWASRVVKVRVGPEKEQCGCKGRCDCCAQKPRKI